MCKLDERHQCLIFVFQQHFLHALFGREGKTWILGLDEEDEGLSII